MSDPVLSFHGVDIDFRAQGEWRRVVNAASFSIGAGERVALVGESGSGKSVTAMAAMGLLPAQSSRVSGQILYRGKNLLDLTEKQWNRSRGDEISMVFQDAMSSLNPLMTIGAQIAEPLMIHRGMGRGKALARATELLDAVMLPGGKSALSKYPHEFSGGMRQRVMIAAAIACDPDVLIADEPTTALDVTVQRGVLDTIRRLSDDLGIAVMMITHDLGVVAEFAHRIVVMYAGRIVERNAADVFFGGPSHPYSDALLGAMPSIDIEPKTKLRTIPGSMPGLGEREGRCVFASRCAFAQDECHRSQPPLTGIPGAAEFACFHPLNQPAEVQRHA